MSPEQREFLERKALTAADAAEALFHLSHPDRYTDYDMSAMLAASGFQSRAAQIGAFVGYPPTPEMVNNSRLNSLYSGFLSAQRQVFSEQLKEAPEAGGLELLKTFIKTITAYEPT